MIAEQAKIIKKMIHFRYQVAQMSINDKSADHPPTLPWLTRNQNS